MAHVIVAINDADRWCGEMHIILSKKERAVHCCIKNTNFGEKSLETKMLKCDSNHLWRQGESRIKWGSPTVLYISVLYGCSIMILCFYNQEKLELKARNKKIPHLIGIILNNAAASSWLQNLETFIDVNRDTLWSRGMQTLPLFGC